MIRKFQATDIDPVMEIWLNGNIDAHSFIAEEYWRENAPAVREQILKAELSIYETDGEILGFAGMRGNYIAGLFVKRGARSMGIGRLILEELKKEQRELSLNVYRENRRAGKFYEREGFTIVSERTEEGTGETEYTMNWRRESGETGSREA